MNSSLEISAHFRERMRCSPNISLLPGEKARIGVSAARPVPCSRGRGRLAVRTACLFFSLTTRLRVDWRLVFSWPNSAIFFYRFLFSSLPRKDPFFPLEPVTFKGTQNSSWVEEAEPVGLRTWHGSTGTSACVSSVVGIGQPSSLHKKDRVVRGDLVHTSAFDSRVPSDALTEPPTWQNC